MFVKCQSFTSACAYINSIDATLLGISGLLIGYQLHHGGCASCTDLILYYTHNNRYIRLPFGAALAGDILEKN